MQSSTDTGKLYIPRGLGLEIAKFLVLFSLLDKYCPLGHAPVYLQLLDINGLSSVQNVSPDYPGSQLMPNFPPHDNLECIGNVMCRQVRILIF